MKTKKKRLTVVLMILAFGLVVGCGPSEEEQELPMSPAEPPPGYEQHYEQQEDTMREGVPGQQRENQRMAPEPPPEPPHDSQRGTMDHQEPENHHGY